ncbi:hypothetical protein BDV37DRAFT_95339 [Aspergillus pseudonomiae]|uniref:Uncharacterized protein n=1 Tax=Aspergillus pseudonomiae TaxID=1506151 RepID=A0A5N7DFU9_9EURO|nr:uncharacterized protein BDV37DRAFT_95339 [Aspergillus pseudonomiae]KAE8405301.1 hypothetical protein BDV37DRAFT_95339 [Aspergillus pseudonomiae]
MLSWIFIRECSWSLHLSSFPRPAIAWFCLKPHLMDSSNARRGKITFNKYSSRRSQSPVDATSLDLVSISVGWICLPTKLLLSGNPKCTLRSASKIIPEGMLIAIQPCPKGYHQHSAGCSGLNKPRKYYDLHATLSFHSVSPFIRGSDTMN